MMVGIAKILVFACIIILFLAVVEVITLPETLCGILFLVAVVSVFVAAIDDERMHDD